MNKKVKRSTEWYLLKVHVPTALKDKNLTTTDLNTLSVMLFLDNTLPKADDGSFFRVDEKLVQDLADSECPITDRQLRRVKLKLKTLGYIDYKSGYHNNITGKGSATTYWVLNKETVQCVDNQKETINNVRPNTKPNTNTNLNSITYNISTLYGECEQTVNSEQLMEVEEETEVQRKYNNIKSDIDKGNFSSLGELQFRITIDNIPAREANILQHHYHQWDRENIYDSEEEDNTPMVQEEEAVYYKSKRA